MLDILFTILYIILFLICLSVLIIIHELGHLTAAKIFNVYCIEFSCGMGPLLWKYKKKGGETQLSLRAIPFGGYVSMYGEGVELPDGEKVDASRSINGIKKWKQAIVLVAGVTMNAVLALVIFFVNNVAFEQKGFEYSNKLSVVEDSKAANSGIAEELYLTFNDSYDDKTAILLEKFATINYVDGSTRQVGVVLTPNLSFANPTYNYTFFGTDGTNIISTQTVELTSEMESIDIIFTVKERTEGDPIITDHPINLDIVDGQLEDSGLRIYVKTYRYDFGEAVVQTFDDFGYSSTAIVQSFVSIFTGDIPVSELSGVVGIGFEARNILDNLGVSKFIYLWGLISVNLAIINLLPFPGLDGWQLFVLIIEAITRKKFPEKVKNIVSFIGLGLLLLLMVVILFKDLWVYLLSGLFSGLVL